MKRFPSATTIRYQLHRLFVTALLAIAAVALLGKAAHAQACGDVGDVPATFLDDYIETLGGLFPLSASECEKITKAAVSACHKAVSGSASCATSQISGARKGAKTGCKAQGAGEDACNDSLGGVLDGIESLLELEADGAHAECDTSFATQLDSTCRGLN
jgi:hypothetical protein